MSDEYKAGWGMPNNSRKAHYFPSPTSLCGKYGFYFGPTSPDTYKSPDDCAACRKILGDPKEAK